jgi:hypothetical protein
MSPTKMASEKGIGRARYASGFRDSDVASYLPSKFCPECTTLIHPDGHDYFCPDCGVDYSKETPC